MAIEIRFKQSWRAYNAGETATFSKEIGERIVQSGVAEACETIRSNKPKITETPASESEAGVEEKETEIKDKRPRKPYANRMMNSTE